MTNPSQASSGPPFHLTYKRESKRLRNNLKVSKRESLVNAQTIPWDSSWRHPHLSYLIWEAHTHALRCVVISSDHPCVHWCTHNTATPPYKDNKIKLKGIYSVNRNSADKFSASERVRVSVTPSRRSGVFGWQLRDVAWPCLLPLMWGHICMDKK